MRNVIASLFVVLILGTVFAGCVGDDDVDPVDDLAVDAEEAKVTATTGSITGKVASDLFEPIAGAIVTIVETARETQVAKNGAFTINDVEPGSYVLHVSADGWVPGERRVTVTAGEVSAVSFVLRPAASDDPWVEATERVGMINSGWAVTAEIPGSGCFYEPTPVYPVESCYKQRSAGSPGREQNFEITDDVETILVELVWSPAGPLGEHLFLDLACPSMPFDERGNPADPEHPCYFASPSSRSPIVFRIDAEHWVENGYNQTGTWLARIFPNHGTLGTYDALGVDAGVAYQQAFRVFISVYHKEPAPEGATGIPDQ